MRTWGSVAARTARRRVSETALAFVGLVALFVLVGLLLVVVITELLPWFSGILPGDAD